MTPSHSQSLGHTLVLIYAFVNGPIRPRPAHDQPAPLGLKSWFHSLQKPLAVASVSLATFYQSPLTQLTLAAIQ